MNIEKTKKPLLNINAATIKNVLKSKKIRKTAKDAFKAVKEAIDTLDVNR